MELNETTAPTEATEAVLPAAESETVEVILVDVERPFLETGFMDYTVTEGLLLLIFVIVLLDFCYSLIRR